MAVRLNGLYSGLDTESLVKSLSGKYQNKIDKYKQQLTLNEYKATSWNSLNSKLYSFYTGAASKLKQHSSFTQTISKSSSSALTVENAQIDGTQSAKILAEAKTASLTSAKIDESVTKNTKLSELGLSAGTYKFNNTEITIEDNDTMSTLMDKIKSTGLNANFDENQHRIYLSAKKSGAEYDFDLSENGTDKSLLNVLGIPSQAYLNNGKYYSDANFSEQITDTNILNKIKNGEAAIKISGSNAKLELNGALYESSSNVFKINEGTYTINNYTEEEITISTTKDSSAVYGNVKSFINSYNELINEMTKLYNTDNQGYKPLTEAQEDAMSEKEVEKWNDIIEKSALHRDDRLGDIINSLKNVMNQGIQMDDGTTMYLSNFGINTGNYFSTDKNERNAYTINGDNDYSNSTSSVNTLEKMIEEDPEKVEEFFTKLSKKMYDTITSETKSTEYSSIYKAHNDKQLATENKRIESEIAKWEEKMYKMEEKYYKQFASMEAMLAQLQSQTDSLSNLFKF